MEMIQKLTTYKLFLCLLPPRLVPHLGPGRMSKRTLMHPALRDRMGYTIKKEAPNPKEGGQCLKCRQYTPARRHNKYIL